MGFAQNEVKQLCAVIVRGIQNYEVEKRKEYDETHQPEQQPLDLKEVCLNTINSVKVLIKTARFGEDIEALSSQINETRRLLKIISTWATQSGNRETVASLEFCTTELILSVQETFDAASEPSPSPASSQDSLIQITSALVEILKGILVISSQPPPAPKSTESSDESGQEDDDVYVEIIEHDDDEVVVPPSHEELSDGDYGFNEASHEANTTSMENLIASLPPPEQDGETATSTNNQFLHPNNNVKNSVSPNQPRPPSQIIPSPLLPPRDPEPISTVPAPLPREIISPRPPSFVNRPPPLPRETDQTPPPPLPRETISPPPLPRDSDFSSSTFTS